MALVMLLVRGAVAEPPPAAEPLTARGYDQRVQDGIDLIYRLRFAEADAHFARFMAAEPDNPLGYFFYAMVDWWRVLVDLEDHSHDEAFYRRVARCIEVCDRRLEAEPDNFDAILFKGGAIGFRGRLRGDRAQYLGAAHDGLACLPLLKRSRLMEPTNKDILFGQGIYNYFRVVIPQRYPVVQAVTWMLEAGDRDLGLRQLEEVAREGQYARAEALYFLAQIHRLFENDPGTALRYLEQLHERYPENALFHRYRARALVDLGRWDQGMALYRDAIRRAEQGQPGYHLRGHIESLYYVGKGAFMRGRYAEVVEVMSAADRLSAGLEGDAEARNLRGYVPLAKLYLGMALDALGRRAEARAQYARVLDLPRFGSSHNLARKYLEQAYQPPG
ncbi:MAG: tetratricopeptide repeat protein [Gemmatimonadota bacterium]